MTKIFYLILCSVFFIYACKGPKAAFSFENKTHFAPAHVSFVNQSQKADTYVWHFGDGHQSVQTNPVNRYVSSGRYEVTLEAKSGKNSSKSSAVLQVLPPQECLVEIQTSKGNMVVKLFDATLQHRDNFIRLAENGYYEGMLFHRVIKGFMIQSGDPLSKSASKGQLLGSGGPGYTIDAEFSDTLYHITGALAAARMGDDVNPEKASSGSQFYIVHGRPVLENILDETEMQYNFKYTPKARAILTQYGGAPQLDQEYTVFGQVIEGMEIISDIATSQTDKNDRPIDDIKILKINIIR